MVTCDDAGRVRRLLDEGRVSVHETTEEGESLLSLACSAGYYELAQVSHLLMAVNIKHDEFNRIPLPSQMSDQQIPEPFYYSI